MSDKLCLALHLFHGRKSLNENLDDWGEDGPVFKCDYVHTTYGAFIHTAEERHDLHIIKDCVYYDGMYYGDWSAFVWTPESDMKLSEFDDKKAIPPADAAVCMSDLSTLLKRAAEELRLIYNKDGVTCYDITLRAEIAALLGASVDISSFDIDVLESMRKFIHDVVVGHVQSVKSRYLIDYLRELLQRFDSLKQQSVSPMIQQLMTLLQSKRSYVV